MKQYDSGVERVKIVFRSWIDDVLKTNVLLWSVVIFDLSLSYYVFFIGTHHIFDLLMYYFISYDLQVIFKDFVISYCLITLKKTIIHQTSDYIRRIIDYLSKDVGNNERHFFIKSDDWRILDAVFKLICCKSVHTEFIDVILLLYVTFCWKNDFPYQEKSSI